MVKYAYPFVYRPKCRLNRVDHLSAPFHQPPPPPPLRTTGLERVVSCEMCRKPPPSAPKIQRPFRRMICRPLYQSNPGPGVDVDYTRVLGSNPTELLVALSANRSDYDKSKRVLRKNNSFF